MRIQYKIAGWVMLVGYSFGVFAQSPDSQGFELLKNLDIYSNVMKELNQDYVDEINPGELTITGIEAMFKSLDPYTNFIPESEVEDYKFITTGQYGGIGSLIHQQDDYVVISEPYENSPAHKAGLRAGDRIIEVNGKPAKGKSYDDVSAILKGQPGTTVNLVVQRPGVEKLIEKSITREIIKVDNIPYSGILENQVAYIRLSGFTQNASKEVKQAFLKMKGSQKLNGVIIDLRGNGGGLLNEAVEIANIFVERGLEIVSTKGKRADKNRTHMTMNPPDDLAIPVVILVDRSSASASEILAGSIQDLDRGLVVGQRTFGKGLVQNVVPLSYNAQMKITVAKYYIPSGRCIQAIDYEHKRTDGSFGKIPDSLIRAFKTKNGRVVYDGGGIQPDVVTKPRRYGNLVLTLYRDYLVFDYATRFASQNPAIDSAAVFQVTDATYQDFLNFLKEKDFTYVTRSERALKEMKIDLERDSTFDAIRPEYEQLQAKLEKDKQEDFRKYESQIRELLKLEIISRYYFQKGKVVSTLRDDQDIRESIALLLDRERYEAIRSGKVVQPKPEVPIPADEDELQDSDNPIN
jgi:carboxyl-terminal processing protease